MSELPAGTVTFFFSDIEGSTWLLQKLGESYKDALATHQELLRSAFRAHGGHEVDTQGDAFFVAFGSAKGAVQAATAAQRALHQHPWPASLPLRVRMGLHTGEAAVFHGGYVGLDVHKAARICSAGHGGQVLLSQATVRLIEGNSIEGISLRDLGEHRLKDLVHPERLYQLVIADLLADFPPLRTLSAPHHNLPIQLSHFIGRRQETKEIKALLGTTKLLTLTGPGGSGKTRLALHVAEELLEDYPDGVWLAELATLSDPSLIPQTMAGVWGVREQASRSLQSALLEYLRPKQMLLVVDSCEHLIEACARWVEILLRACPKLSILITSQELLGLAGEVAWRVPPLSLPPLTSTPRASDLLKYEAIRFFVERAAMTSRDFSLTAQNAPFVAKICQRLDGIPLAIELAAARVKALSVEDIASRLDDCFRLLTGGSRTAMRRQQTLQAAIEWSFSLLSEGEQALLWRLSIFAGGCTLEAVEAICEGHGDRVLELLPRLVDKSLLLKEEKGRQARYRMLETIRLYAQTNANLEEVSTWRDKFLGHFVSWTEQAEVALRGAAQEAWLEHLELDYDNLRLALEWSKTRPGKAELGLRIAGALWTFWEVSGRLSEGRQWLQDLLRLNTGAHSRARAKALRGAGVLAGHQGDYPQANALLEGSLALFQQLGDQRGEAVSLNNLGIIARNQGNYAQATARYEASLALWRSLGDKQGIAASLANLAVVARNQGNHSRATALHEESLQLFRQLGNALGASITLNNLGVIAEDQADYERAQALYKESLKLRSDLGDKLGVSGCLSNLASIAGHLGRLELAAQLFGAAEKLREALNTPLPPDERAEHERKVAAVRAKLDQGAFSAAWAQGRNWSLDQAVSFALENEATPFRP